MESGIKKLIGRNVQEIWMSAEYLKFVVHSELNSDGFEIAYTVEGDCCSSSYFHDFLGVRKLLDNGPILNAYEVHLGDVDADDDYTFTQAYGFALVTEDPTFGEVTSVFSFRNDSNGYYGGWMEPTDASYCSGRGRGEDMKQLTDDWLG